MLQLQMRRGDLPAVVLTADKVGGRHAHVVVVHQRVVTLAQRLAEGPTLAYAAIKRAMQAAATNTLDEQLDLERDLQRELGFSPDYAEGVRAFMEKRSPKFLARPKGA